MKIISCCQKVSKVQKKFQKNPVKRLTYFQYVVQLKTKRFNRLHYKNKEILQNVKYRNCKSRVIDAIGGVENVSSVAHCATRLRVMVKMNQKINKDVVENIKSTRCFFNSGQYQIIFGTGTVKQDL